MLEHCMVHMVYPACGVGVKAYGEKACPHGTQANVVESHSLPTATMGQCNQASMCADAIA